jgi:hypothetical protein
MDEAQYLWDHFKFNAEQRLKGFNFFVLLSIFADGGVFTALEKDLSPGLLSLIGFFIIILATVFWLVDTRSQQLLRLAIPGLKDFESRFQQKSRLFELDANAQGIIVRYTFAFRALLFCQLLFGFGVVLYGLHRWLC